MEANDLKFIMYFELGVDEESNITRYLGITNIVIDVAKQKLQIDYVVGLGNTVVPTNGGATILVMVKPEYTSVNRRTNIDETSVEAGLWTAISTYLESLTIPFVTTQP